MYKILIFKPISERDYLGRKKGTANNTLRLSSQKQLQGMQTGLNVPSLLGCYIVLTGNYLMTFWGSPKPPSPGSSSTACFLDHPNLKMKEMGSSV
jgi:hypothetical protein